LKVLLGLAPLLLYSSACAPTDSPGPRARVRLLTREFPLEIQAGATRVTLPAPAQRVLPANAAWVDFVSALVEPERVVALPPEAFGYSRLDPRAEAWAALPPFPSFDGERILGLAPDLVLAHTWQNPETLTTLRQVGIPVLALPVPETWTEITDTLAVLGAALGVPDRADALLAGIETRRTALRARGAPFAGLAGLSYTNLGQGGWTSGARTTAQILFELAGVQNAAAEVGLVGDVPADAERLLSLRPDFFLVGRPDRTEDSAPSAEFLLQDPALAALPAVRAGRIVSLPPALFTSASPELLKAAEALVEALEAFEPAPR
jgi:iron complex transport system substrate-binding protein